ncbi:hypothetical protein SLE2022_405790 [Rubroshorea leprosula]
MAGLPSPPRLSPRASHPEPSVIETSTGIARPLPATRLLLFGATGDLSRRMLLPSLYALHAEGLIAPGLRIVGTARSDLDDAGFRATAGRGARHLPPRGPQGGGHDRRLPRQAALRRGGRRRSLGLRGARRGGGRGRGAAHRHLSLHRALAVRIDDRGLAGRRARRAQRAHRPGKAARPRSRLLGGDQRCGGRRLHRGADVPHRSLSRQGDGAEPPRAALRQPAVRAAVERGRDRPRPDHRVRDGRPRRARLLL